MHAMCRAAARADKRDLPPGPQCVGAHVAARLPLHRPGNSRCTRTTGRSCCARHSASKRTPSPWQLQVWLPRNWEVATTRPRLCLGQAALPPALRPMLARLAAAAAAAAAASPTWSAAPRAVALVSARAAMGSYGAPSAAASSAAAPTPLPPSRLPERYVPAPRNGDTIDSLFARISRGVDKFRDKFSSWEDVFSKRVDDLAKMDIPARERRTLIRSLNLYRWVVRVRSCGDRVQCCSVGALLQARRGRCATQEEEAADI
jgi:hypothetical protein